MGIYEKHLFPFLLDKQMSKLNYAQERPIALREAKGKILEIGFGTGLNLAHYPDRVNNIVALDVNPGMNKKARERAKASSIEVELACLNGEKLPFDNASFDTVISTWTLCSIDNLPTALAEIHRVLKADGQFLFMDHGLGESKRVQRLQHRLTPVQKVIGCGCRLNVPIDTAIASAGFRIENLEKFVLDGALTPLSASIYRGKALPLK